MTKLHNAAEVLEVLSKERKTTVDASLKKIQLIKHLNLVNGTLMKSDCDPNSWDNLMLWECGEDYDAKFDVILAWNNNGERVTYIGHWNDGVV